MRKVVFTLINLALFISCSVKTNEEKARELIEPEVKASMIKPESYEFSQIKLDSCFSDSQFNPSNIEFALRAVKLYKEYKEYVSDVEKAESSMSIYAPSYGYQSEHSKLQLKKYKSEMEKAQRKAFAVKDEIIQLYKNNKDSIKGYKPDKHEFIGWAVSFGCRAETAGGIKTMGEVLFFLNKDFTEITHRFSEEDIELLQSENSEDLKYDFEEELKEIFESE